jgi:hypothetical protein
MTHDRRLLFCSVNVLICAAKAVGSAGRALATSWCALAGDVTSKVDHESSAKQVVVTRSGGSGNRAPGR